MAVPGGLGPDSDGWGLFRANPEMAGQNDGALAGWYFAHKTGAQHRVPVASYPALVRRPAPGARLSGRGRSCARPRAQVTVLAEWLEERDVCIWLMERPAVDARLPAQEAGQFVLEARAGRGPALALRLRPSLLHGRATGCGWLTSKRALQGCVSIFNTPYDGTHASHHTAHSMAPYSPPATHARDLSS